VTSSTAVLIEFVIKKLEWLHDRQCQNQPHDSLNFNVMLTNKARCFF